MQLHSAVMSHEMFIVIICCGCYWWCGCAAVLMLLLPDYVVAIIFCNHEHSSSLFFCLLLLFHSNVKNLPQLNVRARYRFVVVVLHPFCTVPIYIWNVFIEKLSHCCHLLSSIFFPSSFRCFSISFSLARLERSFSALMFPFCSWQFPDRFVFATEFFFRCVDVTVRKQKTHKHDICR